MGVILKWLFMIAIIFAIGKFLITQFIPGIWELIKYILEIICSPIIVIFYLIRDTISSIFSFLFEPFRWFFGLFT